MAAADSLALARQTLVRVVPLVPQWRPRGNIHWLGARLAERVNAVP